MADKTQTQTYNFLLENKSIDDIKKEPNIEIREKSRHNGKTFKLIVINNNNQIINDDLSENEIFYDTYDTVDDLNDIFSAKIWKLQTIIQEQTQEIQQLKKENKKLKQSNINFDKFKYNAITIYDKKQRKNTGIDKIYEEILPIEDKIIFITTFVHDNQSITEEIIHFYQLTNGNIEVMKQWKQYEDINKYKDDLSLIEPNSNHKKIIKIEPVSIKKFLNNQKESNLKITKSEWITFLSISIFSLCLLSVPAVLTIYLTTIIVGATLGTIIIEKLGILGLSILVTGALDKVLWNLVSHKTEKIKTKTKNTIFWLLRKLPFCKSLSKNKEELEIKNNIKKTIENLTSDKLETRLQTQYDILKQELDNRKKENLDKLISNNKINHKSNNVLENSSIKSENNQNFDSFIRNTVNQQEHSSTISKSNWNKVKGLLTT